MTTHNYEESAKIKAAILKEKREQTEKHIIFLQGYCEAWERCIKFESFAIDGAADILMNYYDIHSLELMSADEQIIHLQNSLI
jgi:hypothetical protein